MRATAVIRSCEITSVPFGDGGAGGGESQAIACVYVVVEAAEGSAAGRFLSGWRGCCDDVRLEWSAARRPAGASVGIEVARCCGTRGALLLRFDAAAHRAALQALAAREVLVVADAPVTAGGATVAAYGVDGAAVRTALTEAERGLRRLVAGWN